MIQNLTKGSNIFELLGEINSKLNYVNEKLIKIEKDVILVKNNSNSLKKIFDNNID